MALQPSPPPLFTRWLNIISAAPPGSPTICGGLLLGKALIIRYRPAVSLSGSFSARLQGPLKPVVCCVQHRNPTRLQIDSQLPFCFCFCSCALPCPALPCLACHRARVLADSSPRSTSKLSSERETRREEGERDRTNRRIELRQEKRGPLSYVRFESKDSTTAGKSTMSAAHISRR
jgi:hypothetical protein